MKIIDFGIATRFSTEHPASQSPEVLEGTLAYMSPEQTGRMNRSLDYRTDFYSLGVDLLRDADRRAARSMRTTMLELVHCHIARDAVPPQRPQSRRVRSRCRTSSSSCWRRTPRTATRAPRASWPTWRRCAAAARLEPFAPGRHDHSDRFQIPQRLYGRDSEVERLLAAFERTRRGRAELMLVAGYSGVGKSALVHEIHKPITRGTRLFHQPASSTSSSATSPIRASWRRFRDLVRQLLTESEVAARRVAPGSERGARTQRAGDPRRDPRSRAGHRPAAAVPGARGGRSREPVQPRDRPAPARPLRARAPSSSSSSTTSSGPTPRRSSLLRVVLTDDGIGRLFLIGAYRDNEVDAMHPLTLALRAIRDGGAKVTSLTLAPLGLADVARLLGDTLQSDRRAGDRAGAARRAEDAGQPAVRQAVPAGAPPREA